MKLFFSRLSNILFILGTLSGGFTAWLYDPFDGHVFAVYACFVVPAVIINYLVHGRFTLWNKKIK